MIRNGPLWEAISEGGLAISTIGSLISLSVCRRKLYFAHQLIFFSSVLEFPRW